MVEISSDIHLKTQLLIEWLYTFSQSITIN